MRHKSSSNKTTGNLDLDLLQYFKLLPKLYPALKLFMLWYLRFQSMTWHWYTTQFGLVVGEKLLLGFSAHSGSPLPLFVFRVVRQSGAGDWEMTLNYWLRQENPQWWLYGKSLSVTSREVRGQYLLQTCIPVFEHFHRNFLTEEWLCWPLIHNPQLALRNAR